MNILNAKIQIKHRTALEFTELNEVLLQGEQAIETDTRKRKIGDGVTNWNDLGYENNGGTELIGYRETLDINGDISLIEIGDIDNETNGTKILINPQSETVKIESGDALNFEIGSYLNILNSAGVQFNKGSFYTLLDVNDALSGDRALKLPDSDGTLATEQYVDAKKDTLQIPTSSYKISDFIVGDWSFTSGLNTSGTTEQCFDNNGQEGTKITLLADGRYSGQKNVDIPASTFKKGAIGFKIKINDISKIYQFHIEFKVSDGTNYFKYFNLDFLNKNYAGDYVYVLADINDFGHTGAGIPFSENTLNITRMYFGVLSSFSGLEVEFYDYIINAKQKASFSLSFDDGNETDLTIAKPLLDKYGFVALTSIIKHGVGLPNYLSSAQVQELHNNNWTIACHGQFNHYNQLSGYTEIYDDVKENVDFLETLVPRPDFYVYPEGAFTRDSLQALNDLGFKGSATTTFIKEPLNFQNKYYISRVPTTNKTITQLKEEIDFAIENGLHFDFYTHKLTETTEPFNTTIDIYTEFIQYLAEVCVENDIKVYKLDQLVNSIRSNS